MDNSFVNFFEICSFILEYYLVGNDGFNNKLLRII